VTADRCYIDIYWEKPDDNGFPILSYFVEVQAYINNFFSLTCGTDFSETSCRVSMNVLRAEPYNLRAGDPVVVRVSAENRNGFSTASPADENSNVSIFDVPE
jgi:hypothetical protein